MPTFDYPPASPDNAATGQPVEVYYPIRPDPDIVKVVYSNHPRALRGLASDIFPMDAPVVWFPECELNGRQMDELAKGLRYKNHPIIATNSALLLKAFQMHRRTHPKTITFFYVQYAENYYGQCTGEFIIHATNNLDGQPCPQISWERAQAGDILCSQSS